MQHGIGRHKAVQWASYQIRNIACCACAGNAGNVFPRRRFQRKPLVSDPGMHHGTCVTHVPWCMSGSLASGGGKNVPGACAPAIFRIWQEAHELNHIKHDVISGLNALIADDNMNRQCLCCGRRKELEYMHLFTLDIYRYIQHKSNRNA